MSVDETRYFITAPGATDEELAALIAVLEARRVPEGPKPGSDRPPASGWNAYHRAIATHHQPGRDAWRSAIRF